MTQPSFFIVGAPKCGTTALSKYLNCHPDVFIPEQKELHFFDTDLKTPERARNLKHYLSLFEPGANKICGEGTTTYLYSKTAAQEIYRFDPDAKIVIMLREPVEMMYSFHSQLLFNGSSETVEDFKEAIALEAPRKEGQQIPTRCREPRLLFYRELAKFSEQVNRYLDLFGPDQVKILLFHEFTENTVGSFQSVLEFIGAEPNFEMEFVRMNSSKRVRNKKIQELIKYPPKRLLEVGKYLLPLPQAQRRQLLEWGKNQVSKANTQQFTRPSLDPALRKQLTQELSSDIQKLSQLINRDLAHWYS
ncbi:MAG: sulfotransferase [Cyanobacteria bacterium P01_F01_bin.150]